MIPGLEIYIRLLLEHIRRLGSYFVSKQEPDSIFSILQQHFHSRLRDREIEGFCNWKPRVIDVIQKRERKYRKKYLVCKTYIQSMYVLRLYVCPILCKYTHSHK